MTLSVRRPKAVVLGWSASIERPADGSKALVVTCPWLFVKATV